MSTTSKYKYCPDYDDYLVQSKQKLQERLTHHHHLREPLIYQAVSNTIDKIDTLGKKTYIDEFTPDYKPSFINMEEINQYINEWNGPEISKQYMNQFNKKNSKNYHKIIKFDKFHKDAVNWQDQSSYRVTGKHFFAKHIIQLRNYFATYCNKLNVSENEKQNIINFACINCAVELLSIKTKFKRSKQQPLIRYTTIRDSKELHDAFKILYPELNLSNLKETVKKNNKKDPTKKGGNKYRVKAKEFAENLIVLACNLLETEKQNIESNNNNNNDECAIPQYFQDKDKHMDVEINDNNSNNSTEICEPPKPPKPSPPTPTPIATPTICNNAINDIDDCVCGSLPPPIFHNDGTKTIWVAKRVSVNQNENISMPVPVPVPVPGVYYNNYMDYNGYGCQRGNYNTAINFRYNPMSYLPPQLPQVQYQNMNMHMPPSIPVMGPMEGFMNRIDNGNYENNSISDTSSLTYSTQSHSFGNNSQETFMYK